MFDLGLTNKVAIVTGGSDGLGFATSKRLVSEGANLVICARRADHLASAAEQLRESGSGEVLAIAGDVTSAEDIQNIIDATHARFGGIDILVNNAGASAASKMESLDDEAWEADLQLKLMAAVRLSRGVIPSMRKRGGGAIVNASIGGGKAPLAGSLPTSVTRAAGLNLTKSLANELAHDNIRVNAICIGLIKSEQWVRRAAAAQVTLDDFYAGLAEKIPLGRVGAADDYADAVAFLVSERSAYITGTALNVDGGLCPVL